MSEVNGDFGDLLDTVVQIGRLMFEQDVPSNESLEIYESYRADRCDPP